MGTVAIGYYSGGTIYTVTGQRLDIVEEPRLLLYVRRNVVKRQAQDTQEIELESEVRINEAIVLLCSASTVLQKKHRKLDIVRTTTKTNHTLPV